MGVRVAARNIARRDIADIVHQQIKARLGEVLHVLREFRHHQSGDDRGLHRTPVGHEKN